MNLKSFFARSHSNQTPLDATETERISQALASMFPYVWAEANTDAKRALLIQTVAPLAQALNELAAYDGELSGGG